MKKIQKISLFLGLTVAAFAATTPVTISNAVAADKAATSVLKIAVVDGNKFVLSIPSYIEANKKIQADFKIVEAEAAATEAKFLKQRDEIQTKTSSFAAATANLTEAKRKAKQAELNKEINEYETKSEQFVKSQQQNQAKFQELHNNLVKKTLEIADAILKDYATKNKYTLVLDSNAVAYQNFDNDITDILIKIAVDSKK